MNINNTQKRISYVLKSIVALSAIIGTFLSAYAGRHSFMGGSRVFMYFTIQSNIAIAIICLIGIYLLMKNNPTSRLWQIIKLVGTVSITLTGIVFCFVLAPTMGAAAWNVQNILTHVVVPVVSVVDFFVISTTIELNSSDTVYVIIPPIAYAIYAGIGYVKGWQFADGINYPYFFLNWGSEAGAFGFSKNLPFIGTAWWIILIFIFLLIVGLIYLAISKMIKRKLS